MERGAYPAIPGEGRHGAGVAEGLEAREGNPKVSAQEETTGLVFAGLCALNGAFVPGLAKLTTNRGDPLFVAAATATFAGLFAATVLAVRGELGWLVRPGKSGLLALIGALGTALAFLFFFAGTHRSSAIEAVLCLQCEPAYSLVLSWLALGHRPTPRRFVATAMLLCGIALAVGLQGFRASTGVWFLLATPLCWQLSHLIVLRGLPGTPPLVLTGARYIWGGALLALFWLAQDGIAQLPPARELAQIVPTLALQGVVLSYLGTVLWYQSIARLDLGRATAIVVPSIPLLSLAATWLLVGELASLRQWVGLAIVLAGVLAFIRVPEAKPRARATSRR
jgi:drug/metabolite transporter (DMT)-like permease